MGDFIDTDGKWGNLHLSRWFFMLIQGCIAAHGKGPALQSNHFNGLIRSWNQYFLL